MMFEPSPSLPVEPATGRRVRLTRRRLLFSVGATALGVGVYTWRIEPHWVEVVRRDLPIRNLPESLQGRTLAQLSDIHVGTQVDSDYLTNAMRTVSALEPDLVCITGDFMSAGDSQRIDEVARVMDKLRPPRLGCLAILGNHDYGDRWNSLELADRLVAKLAGLGIRVLRNDAHEVSALTVVGLDDLWANRFQPAKVLGGLAPDAPAVVLCHNPDAADRPEWGSYRGWILSGHTHGGQCKPPFLPPPLLPVQNRRYTAGAFDLDGGRWMYINRGLGHLKRVRFNVRPEITLFRMVGA
jgi:predicted MPP superfamily phosphohydrolase